MPRPVENRDKKKLPLPPLSLGDQYQRDRNLLSNPIEYWQQFRTMGNLAGGSSVPRIGNAFPGMPNSGASTPPPATSGANYNPYATATRPMSGTAASLGANAPTSGANYNPYNTGSRPLTTQDLANAKMRQQMSFYSLEHGGQASVDVLGDEYRTGRGGDVDKWGYLHYRESNFGPGSPVTVPEPPPPSGGGGWGGWGGGGGGGGYNQDNPWGLFAWRL